MRHREKESERENEWVIHSVDVYTFSAYLTEFIWFAFESRNTALVTHKQRFSELHQNERIDMHTPKMGKNSREKKWERERKREMEIQLTN